MLRSESADAAGAALRRESPEDYNPFNLLVADRRAAWVATNHRSSMAVTTLDSGLHLITNLDLNDPRCPRIAGSYQLFAALLAQSAPPPGSVEFRAHLRRILSTHDTPLDPRSGGSGNSLCLHSDQYGTRSSTLIFLDVAGRWTYLHANEPPCRRDYDPEPAMELMSRR
jgi:uncharacterized protein with NRDE domain